MSTRKQRVAELTADDPFLENANRIADTIQKNGKKILAGLLGVFVLTGLVLMVLQQQERGAAAMTTDLTKALDGYREATDPQKVFTSTVPGALETEAKEALPAFTAIISAEPGSGAASIARLYAADLSRRAGDDAAAEKLYSDYLSAAAPDDAARFVALEGAGYAAEAQGNHDRAIKHFSALLELPGTFYHDRAHMHLGRLYEQKDDKAKALEAYKKIVEDFPESKVLADAKKRVEALE